MCVLDARDRQSEMIEPMIKVLARDGDAERARVGEIGKAHPPLRPGGCSWRKITSRLGPLSARHPAMRRSRVRRTPGAIPGLRRQISSKIATARRPGAASSIGTLSLSHTPANGFGTAAFYDGNRESVSIR